MEEIAKNAYISKEIKSINSDGLENIIDSIDGDITVEKIYQKIFQKLGINLYKAKGEKYYIELKRYVDKLSNNQCKESQILKNKYAVDKGKILKLKDLDIDKSYEINKITKSKRVIEINGLQTVNDSIKRFNKDVSEEFFLWETLCQAMIISIPKLVEVAVKKYFQKEFDKIHEDYKCQQEQIDMLKKHSQNKIKQIDEMQIKMKEYDKQKKEIDELKKQLESIKNLINN